jgi:hypothetical protein
MTRLSTRLTMLVQQCIDALSRVPAQAEDGAEPEGLTLPPHLAAASPSETLAPWPPVMARREVARPTPEAAQEPSSSVAAAGAVPPQPEPVAPMEAPAQRQPEKPADQPVAARTDVGLVLAPDPDFAAGPGAAPEPVPAGPDYERRSEEEAVRSLQTFFNENSPDGTLLRLRDQEFERMVRQLVSITCREASLSSSEMAYRVRQLKDTLVLRKKLKNNLVLPEFKAYFTKRK